MKGVDTVQLLGLIGESKRLEMKQKSTHNHSIGENPIELDKTANDYPDGILSSHSIASFSSEMSLSKHEEVCGTCRYTNSMYGSHMYYYCNQAQTFAPPAEEKAHGSVSMKTYFRFFVAGCGYVLLIVLSLLFVIAQVSSLCVVM